MPTESSKTSLESESATPIQAPIPNKSMKLNGSPQLSAKLLEEYAKHRQLSDSINSKFDLLPADLVKKLEEDWIQPSSLDKKIPIRLQQNLAILVHIYYLKGELQEGLKQVDLVLERAEKTAAQKIVDQAEAVRKSADKRALRNQRRSERWNGRR